MALGRRKSTALVVPRPRAVVAAASAIALDGTSWKNWKLGDQRWQEEAWRQFDQIGSAHYAATWMGNAISRCRLFIAELDQSKKPGDEVTDPELAVIAETMFGGPANKAEAQKILGTQLYVVGESYIVAEAVENADTDIWYIVSTSEIRRQGGQVIVDRSHVYGGGRHALVPGKDLLIRVWTPHPRRYDAADSSMRSTLPDLRELEQLRKKVFAQIDSRLAGAGLMFLPDELEFPGSDAESSGSAGLMKLIEAAMARALIDQSDPAALVPIIVQVAGEYIDKIKWLTFETPFQAETLELRKEALRQVAVGLDLPPEVLLGQGDSNHWSAWQIEESTIKLQIEPLLGRIADALTTAYLRPALTILGQDPDAYTFWYDTSALAIRPDRQADALALAEKGLLSDAAVRKAGNWSEDDAPAPEEQIRKFAIQLVLTQPTLITNKDIQSAIGVKWTIEEQAAGISPPPPPPLNTGAPKPRALPSAPKSTETPAQEAALLIGADLIVKRALELGGKRLLTAKVRGRLPGVPAGELHTRMEVSEGDAQRILADAWVPVAALAQRLGMNVDTVTDMLRTYTQALMVHGERHEYDRFALYVSKALDLIGHGDCGRTCHNPLHPGVCRGRRSVSMRVRSTGHGVFHLPGKHRQDDHGQHGKAARLADVLDDVSFDTLGGDDRTMYVAIREDGTMDIGVGNEGGATVHFSYRDVEKIDDAAFALWRKRDETADVGLIDDTIVQTEGGPIYLAISQKQVYTADPDDPDDEDGIGPAITVGIPTAKHTNDDPDFLELDLDEEGLDNMIDNLTALRDNNPPQEFETVGAGNVDLSLMTDHTIQILEGGVVSDPPTLTLGEAEDLAEAVEKLMKVELPDEDVDPDDADVLDGEDITDDLGVSLLTDGSFVVATPLGYPISLDREDGEQLADSLRTLLSKAEELPGSAVIPARSGKSTFALHRNRAGGAPFRSNDGLPATTRVTPTFLEAFHLPGRHNQADHGRKKKAVPAIPTPPPVPAPVAKKAAPRKAARVPPAATASPWAPVPPSTKPDPALDAARDVIYGRDPKAGTAARQLTVYAKLRRTQYAGLSPAEQSTLLGDLAYIATTSRSSASTTRAQKLIDRFTPPGTPAGQVSSQAVYPPAGAGAGQTLVADPNGTAGLLTVMPASKRGRSGDGWFRTPGGGTGPWGQYGASGILLRHVDPADGTERFLMVQRGPGISDPGKWQFPGGAQDENENPYTGGAREVVEELGFKTRDLQKARVHGTHETSIPGGWSYTSIAATVDTQLTPDLSSHHARLETADAKWMTRAEIDALDSGGKLLRPLAGGQLQGNVMTLFPTSAVTTAPGRPNTWGGPTTRPPRLVPGQTTVTPAAPAKPKKPHKVSRATDLMPDKAAKDKLRQDIKHARVNFDGKTADGRLAAIGAMQGFDETPTVVDRAEFDRLLATGDYIEVFRGVRGATGVHGYRAGRGGAVSQTKSAADIHEEFRTGAAYYGLGMFGNGYYFATDERVAKNYSDGTVGSVVRALIPKDAKIAKIATIEREAHAASAPRSKAKGVYEEGTLYDEGRYAAARGHDAIRIRYGYPGSNAAVPRQGHEAFNVLNRSVMIVQEA